MTLTPDERQADSIETPPQNAVRAAVARWLLMRIAPHVPVRVVLPNGTNVGPSRADLPVLEILSDSFFHRLGVDLKIGLGESFMAGEWRPAPGHDLADVLTPYAERLLDIVPAWMRRFRKLVEPLQPKHEENDKSGARSNIARHYDLSNDLFAALFAKHVFKFAFFVQCVNCITQLIELNILRITFGRNVF